MFLTELSPLFQGLTQHPIAFLGGLTSGLLRLSLADDPVKSWLDQQLGVSTTVGANSPNGQGSGPQSISID